jgi:serine protease Do
VDQLKQYGHSRWGWIGVRLQTPSDDLAAGFHLASAEGALIARVEKGGPADTAGILEGDLVLSFAGTEVRHARQLPRYVAHSPIGEEAEIVILRGGERKTVKVKIGQLEESASVAPDAPHAKARRHKFGKMSFEPLSDDTRRFFAHASDAEGAVVSSTPQSLAAMAQLQPGDLVVEAAHQRVRSVEELEERVAELRRAERAEVLLTLQDRDGGVRFVSLPLDDE